MYLTGRCEDGRLAGTGWSMDDCVFPIGQSTDRNNLMLAGLAVTQLMHRLFDITFDVHMETSSENLIILMLEKCKKIMPNSEDSSKIFYIF